MHASLQTVWDAFTKPSIIEKWGGGLAKMDAHVGTHFTLWGGDIHGVNKEIAPMKMIVQEWYGGAWPHPSIVTFTLSEKNGLVTVELDHDNIPDEAAKDIEQGWKEYYLGPMKELVESK